MNNKESLIGKTVSLFLDGGWEIVGEVKSSDDTKFIVEQDGDLFMVFKNKVSCLLISETARTIKSDSPKKEGKVFRKNSQSVANSDLFPMNGMSYDESSMSIPGGLLSEDLQDDDDDLSVFFKGGHEISDNPSEKEGGESGKIEFKVEHDTSD
jgi:sRNA-binding regulator protein Hfq